MSFSSTLPMAPAFPLSALRFRCACGFITEVRLEPQWAEQLPSRCPKCKSKAFATLGQVLDALRSMWQQATLAGVQISGVPEDSCWDYEEPPE
jgi:hypothetical protein